MWLIIFSSANDSGIKCLTDMEQAFAWIADEWGSDASDFMRETGANYVDEDLSVQLEEVGDETYISLDL